MKCDNECCRPIHSYNRLNLLPECNTWLSISEFSVVSAGSLGLQSRKHVCTSCTCFPAINPACCNCVLASNIRYRTSLVQLCHHSCSSPLLRTLCLARKHHRALAATASLTSFSEVSIALLTRWHHSSCWLRDPAMYANTQVHMSASSHAL